MELTNEFRVTASIERAWDVFTNVELIAPCMPGAQLDAIEGDDYHGTVKVKVGPITAQYKGIATFQETDEAGRKLVLKAQGRETRGQGNANATVTATMTADGAGTLVSVVTDLTVTGRVAQFGRGVLADVSARLLDQFVSCLESGVLSDVATPVATASAREVEPIDLLDMAGAPLAKRLVPAGLAALAFLLFWRRRRRKRRRRAG